MERIGSLIGPYRLRRLIGSGGMGEVYAAVHEHLDQEVALKLLKPEAAQDRQLVGRFLQEGRALASLKHPGVVRVLDCDQLADGTIFLAMELLQGLSLWEWMRRRPGPVPREDALAIGRQIAEVMADIHAKSIIHRDLKPENVFLCPDESVAPGYRIKLLDFGIAKVPPSMSGGRIDTQVQTGAPTLLGTATYMAPEQFRDVARVDESADVYSLGVLLFELLAGRTPFESREWVELAGMHVRDAPPHLRELVPDTPGALATFIASMLAKTPSERPTMLRCKELLGSVWVEGEDECPVPGLAAFTEAQAEIFFGRQAEADELLGLLEASRQGRQRWVLLEGASGVGKSSLVHAGLLPRLKQQGPQEAPKWRVATLHPSHAPIRGLALAFHAAYVGTSLSRSVEELEEALLAGPEAMRALVTAHTPPGCCLLLVIEQLEEFFMMGEEERLRLDGLLSAALVAPDSPLRLLTTVRTDFVHRMEQLPRLARQLNEAARYTLRALEGDALRSAIQGMAQHVGLRLAEGLLERMVQDATSEGSRLPLLGHTLRGLWALSHGALVTHEHYKQLGGVEGALARQAEQLLEGLGEEGRERAKWLLLDMVQVSRGAPAIRRSRSRHEVLAAAGGDERAEEVLSKLSGMRAGVGNAAEQALRLVVVSGGPAPSSQRVDLVHATLLQRVPSIARWIEQEGERLEQSARLEAAAHDWEQRGRPRDFLAKGLRLEQFRQSVLTLAHPGLRVRKASEQVLSYLDESTRLDRRQRWIRWMLMAAALVAVAAILGSAVQAVLQRQRAEARLQQLIDLSDEFVSDVDWALARRPFTLPVRMKQFERFDKILAGLFPEELEAPEVQRVLIKTWHRRGDLAFHNETLEQAGAFLRSALEAIERGLESYPEDWSLNFRLGLSHSKRGKVAHARGELEEARAHFLRAIEIFKRLQPRDVPDDRRTRATSDAELADLELEAGRASAAVPLYDSAIRLLERNQCPPEQVRLTPDDCLYDQSLLAEALGARARAAQVMGDGEGAEALFQRAENVGRLASEADPGSAYARWVLARILIGIADLQASRNQHEAAARSYEDVRTLGHELRIGEPSNKRYALALVDGLRGSESLARLQGDLSRAEHLRGERCVLLGDFRRQDPEDPRFRSTDCL
jgi:tetratricopeptide (TPR) repeat protein/tRNA A-37 threonylcarbamoyl transferase component Bud32